MDNYLDGYAKDKCENCGKDKTTEGHDGCIGYLHNVKNACCGHGEAEMAYVQFLNGSRISGKTALKYITNNKNLNDEIYNRKTR